MTKKRAVTFEESSGNVFADLGLEDADGLYARACLGAQVMKILREGGYTQREAAKLLGVKQPEISAIMRAKFSRFSQERLINFLNRLNRKVTIAVSPCRRGERFQEVTAAW